MFIVIAMGGQKLSVGYLGIKEIWTNVAEWFVGAFRFCPSPSKMFHRVHCAKKWSFPLRISSVNVTRSAGNKVSCDLSL